MATRERAKFRWRVLPWVAVAAALVLAVSIDQLLSGRSRSDSGALAGNRFLDPGTQLSGPAPDFTLTDQFGRRASLSSFRGQVVILAFNDSQCTTICPVTTTAMVQAKQLLGPAGKNVQLLGVDANPAATGVSDVLAYSRSHGMLHQWRFLTGSLPALKQVWNAYHVAVAIEQGQIDHTPALFMIDTRGRLSRLFLTQQSYAAIGQFGQLLADRAASLLPGHPRVYSAHPYTDVPPVGPETRTVLPGADGHPVTIGAGSGPQLSFFFASWTSQTFPLAKQLAALEAYQREARARRLPRLVAVDEATVEPPKHALPHASFPIAIDYSGRVGDGYQVQGEPWFVLTSSTGRILSYYDASTQGPLTSAGLIRAVRAALRPAPATPGTGGASAALAGSPPALAALHGQAGQLLGPETALVARVSALRGYPVVLNAWASWCGPCRSEFSLFASVSLRFGRQVAFLGVDTDDSPADAQSFLATHRLSYPSYQTTATNQFQPLLPQGLAGLPTTIFINRSGKVKYVHTGQYEAQGTLDADVQRYALGG